MPHHAIGLLDSTTQIQAGMPFYLQGETMATGAALKNLQPTEYQLNASLTTVSGTGGATIKIHNSDNLWVVSTSTTTVTRRSGPDFTGLSGSLWINGTQYTISSVTNAAVLELTGSAGTIVSGMASDSAPIGTITLTTPGAQTLSDVWRSVGKTPKKYFGLVCTAISGTGSAVQAYGRFF